MIGWRIDPAWLARWVGVPVVAALLAAVILGRWTPPFVREEPIVSVSLLDGQAYFGHLTDGALSDTVVLRDVYYLQDARDTTTNLQLGLVRRGTELHQPADGMTIRRERILLIETVGTGSQVWSAIVADRSLRAAVAR